MSKKKKSSNFDLLNDAIVVITIIAIALVPLLVRINMTEHPLATFSWHASDSAYFDVFTLVKSQVLIVLGFISFVLILIRQVKFKTYSLKDPVLILSVLFLGTILISSIISSNRKMSFIGAPGRYEGLLTWFSYISIFLMIYGYKWRKTDLKKIIVFFITSNIVLSIIGLFQYFGVELLVNELLKPFITDSSMKGIDFSTYSKIDYKAIIQTLDHYNYVGFFLSLSFPVVITLALYEKRKIYKIGLIILLALMVFNLVGSTARGGLVGIIVSLPIFLLFNRKMLFKSYKTVIALVAVVVIVFTSFEVYTDGFLTNRFKAIFTTLESEKTVEEVLIEENSITFNLKGSLFKLNIDTSNRTEWLVEYTVDGMALDPSFDDTSNALVFNDQRLSGVSITLSSFNEDTLLVVNTYGQPWYFGYDDQENLSYLNLVGKYDLITKPESIGFENNERMGSARGYIWSRSLPLIFEKPIFGYGPDTFVTVFPQQDYVGKYHAYYTTNMIVDKAHNIFIQLAINSGVVSLILYLMLNIMVIKRHKMYDIIHFQFSNEYQAAFVVALFSYFIASFFNDSTVHVSPLYWCLIALTLNREIKDVN